MDISAFPQHDEVTETFEKQNALIQQLQGENADLKQQLAEAQSETKAGAVLLARLTDKCNDLGSQLATTQAEVERLREALKPFAAFYSFIQAGIEIGDLTPLNEHSCIVSVTAGGGSDYIWWRDMQNAHKALSAPQPDVKDKLASIHKRMENVTQGDVDAALEFTVDMSADRIAKFRAFEKAVTDFTDGKINTPQLVAAFLALKEEHED